jgi:asparagine synthase (glutamine-hydrolysing)
MCGIVGGFHFKPGGDAMPAYQAAVQTLALRGPDGQRVRHLPPAYLGHARLSILDLSQAAFQPMADPSGRYHIVFNGEVFNFKELAAEVRQAGVTLHTTSDTEILLHLLIRHGAAALNKLNGFFALAFYDSQTQTLLLARDRYGVKPLYTYTDGDKFWFASELKALFALGLPRTLNETAVASYFALNYLPPHTSIIAGVQPLAPAHYQVVSADGAQAPVRYYAINQPAAYETPTEAGYAAAQKTLANLLEDAVRIRLVADVPVGVFLSGGIDSSVVTALAARHKQSLHTYSIGFDDKLYDETDYAELVAKQFGTQHTVFRLSFDEIAGHLQHMLAYVDEPFADASAINYYILSKYVRRHVTVALGGDGADELLAGYAKHHGELLARSPNAVNAMLKLAGPVLQALPANRNSSLLRKVWQVQKYARGLALPAAERYLQWARVLQDDALGGLLQPRFVAATPALLQGLHVNTDFNDVLRADFALVLPGDMLTKVDRMSMANSLEVRTPFLDYRVVDFAFGLPSAYKINRGMRKRILQDAFRSVLPPQLYNRPKQGFEVPVRGLMLSALRQSIEQLVLDESFIRAQGIFRYQGLQQLWQTVQQGRNGKDDWTLWAVVVFQNWWQRYFTA